MPIKLIIKSVLLSAALVGCSSNSTYSSSGTSSSADNQTTLEPQLLLDSTTTNLGTIQPFRSIALNPKVPVASNTVEIRYVDINTSKTITQHAQKSESDAAFNVLVPPFNIDESTRVNIYIDSVNNEQYLGALTIDALPNLNTESNPGEYSLHGMNAILLELRSARDVAKLNYQSNELNIVGSQENWIALLNGVIDNFQAIINVSTDAVVFNSPVLNPETGEEVINQLEFKLMDRVFLALSDRLVKKGILFDDNALASGSVDNPKIADSFALFAHAIEDFVATKEGVQVLASLSINAEKSTNSDNLATVTDVFRSTLIPSLVTQLLTNDRSSYNKPSSAALEHFNMLTDTIDLNEQIEKNENYILNNALETLLWFKLSVNALP